MIEAIPAAPPAVQVTQLSRHFGRTCALDHVSLTVPRGGVLGLIGGNGAGKTTLIKHLLGLLKPQSGTVRVFGHDPIANPVGTLGRIGYMSEERDLPLWMRVSELMRYQAAFYPNWDPAYADELCAAFELRQDARITHLSRGQKARTALLIALAHRPDLLVLDEPSSGLDPVVRRDILSAIIRTVADEGRTVLFSSHLLDEVERVADRIAMIHNGRLVFTSSMDDMKDLHHRLTLRFPQPIDQAPALVGAMSSSGGGQEWTYICQGEVRQLEQAAQAIGGTVVSQQSLSLDEVFVTRVAQ